MKRGGVITARNAGKDSLRHDMLWCIMLKKIINQKSHRPAQFVCYAEFLW